ncbi:hypothetical protein EON65_01725 [archaeon]|nr:MAG: hypothetical protein EON65_01725 [archaeon]
MQDDSSVDDSSYSPDGGEENVGAEEKKENIESDDDSLNDLDDEDYDDRSYSMDPSREGTISTVLTEDRSVFTGEVASAMDLLREACNRPEEREIARSAFEQIRIICKKRFYSKTRLASSGAPEHLAQLFCRWRRDSDVLVVACGGMCQFVNGETDNKMALGVLNVCEELTMAIRDFSDDMKVIRSCCELMVDLCNNVLKGVLKKYVKGKSPTPLGYSGSPKKSPPVTVDDEDFLFSDNRSRFKEAGICELLTSILKSIVDSEDLSDEAIHTTIVLLQTMTSLSCSLLICKQFGQDGLLPILLKLIKDRFPLSRSSCALYLIVHLCADQSAGNKLLLAELNAPKVFIDFFHDICHIEKDYVTDPHFLVLVEQLSWAWLNCLMGCDLAVQVSVNVSYCSDVVDNTLLLESIPTKQKQKLRLVEKRLFYM